MSAQTSLSTLPELIHEAFGKLLISADDSVSQDALTHFWSPHVQETDVSTTSHFSREKFGELIGQLRAQYTNRKLVSEAYVITTPQDKTRRTGSLAATHVFTACEEAKEVTVTVVAVLRIGWVSESTHGHHDHGGHREVVTEAFIIGVE
ncbi:hypothetical protein R3P38DRAFT_3485127 [Favolaschia claudopus]|uniref:SnoaL-like domain-containing protein n=1 Tax=Favolaschia claudopus TaxID=2862362 RepID=A0AAW0CDN7_9AGAR